MIYYEEEDPGFLQRYRAWIGGGVVVALVIAVWFGQKLLQTTARPHQEQRIVTITLPSPPVRVAPPPPPARPPPVSTESEQKMITQEPVSQVESKPDEITKAGPAPGDAAGPATSIQGDGSSDGFGLRAGNGLGNGTGNSVGGGGRSSRWGWYAGKVQSVVSEALRNNGATRSADFRVEARIWADQNGRITRVRLAKSTGDAALDSALTNTILVGLILQEPPPEGMPMPIVMRLTARHPTTTLSGVYP